MVITRGYLGIRNEVTMKVIRTAKDDKLQTEYKFNTTEYMIIFSFFTMIKYVVKCICNRK
jgi:hypothetical protein